AGWTSWLALRAKAQAPLCPSLQSEYLRLWAKGVQHLVGLDYEVVEGEPPPSPQKGRLVVANHRASLDVVILAQLFGGHFVANHRTQGAPIVGKASALVDTIYVDRSSRRSGAQAIRKIRRFLREGRTVILFPEGTTHSGDEVHPFHPGAFLAVLDLDAEIVPVGIAYPPGHEFIEPRLGEHLQKLLERPKNRAWVAIGEACDARFAHPELLRDKVQDLVYKARKARGA
ncbi:MAG: 1-acyl-sn-glycerol-3-phosphate acyltransferase, partial [Deltaproteobacteria bacterium]|nr:1-acyl-sn-glycerol-3-phosphate acyltransferase [Deltaproteobacteria bacterium]